jgi:hypothetical protein
VARRGAGLTQRADAAKARRDINEVAGTRPSKPKTVTGQTFAGPLVRYEAAGRALEDEAYRRIQRLYGGPYLELFGRARDGWTTWGNELSPPRETWREMWVRPFDYSQLDGDAS